MKIRIILILNFMVCFFVAYAQNPFDDCNLTIVIQDDFNTFNSSRWEIGDNQVHDEGSNEEPQVYTSDNVYVDSGKLVLRTKRQDHAHPGNGDCYYIDHGGHKFTSGKVRGRQSYKYGYFEIYAKIPAGQGYWPAFWMWEESSDTTDYWYNEIDIFEGNGCLTDSVTCNVHWNFESPKPENLNNHGMVLNIPAINYSQHYHWYGMKWDPYEISWYVDRQLVRTICNNMEDVGIQNPMHIVINSALFPYSWPCRTDTTNIQVPNYMYVDTVNVCLFGCDDNTVVNEINYSSFDYKIKKSITLSEASSLTYGQNIYLKATDFIELQSGFEAPLGSRLSLQIMECTN